MRGESLYGIALFHNRGDILAATPLARRLKTREPECRVVWFTSERFADVLAENPYLDRVEALPGDPWELDGRVEELKASRPWTRFFTPAPYMNPELHRGRAVFETVREACGAGPDEPFSFVLRLTPEEKALADRYWRALPEGPKILVETEFFSDQSFWSDDLARDLLEILEPLSPVFLFTSRRRPVFLDWFEERYPKAYWCREPFRLNLEFYNRCSLFVGVSSGISALTLCDACRTDVLHLELVRGWPWGGGCLGRQENLQVCYSRERFRAALEWAAIRLTGMPAEPDFSPLFPARLAGDGRMERSACPVCGSRESSPREGNPAWEACGGCGTVYRKRIPLHPPGGASGGNLFLPAWEEMPGEVRERLLPHGEEREGTLLLAGPGGLEDWESRLSKRFFLRRILLGKRGLEEPLDRLLAEGEGAFQGALILHQLHREAYPLEVLERVEYLLRPGGLLLATVPTLHGDGEGRLDEAWPLPECPGETVHLDYGGLRGLAQQAGFHPLHASVLERDWGGEEGGMRKADLLSRVPREGRERLLERIRERGLGWTAWFLGRKRGPAKARLRALPVRCPL